MTTIRIPPVLRDSTGGSRTVEVSGSTVSEALDDLFVQHPDLWARIAPDGTLSEFINVYLNDRDVRYRDGLATAVTGGDTIIILPAMAGGAREIR
jgi:molybdopterin converting factor small subunit